MAFNDLTENPGRRLIELRDRSVDTNETEKRSEHTLRVTLTNDETLAYAREAADAQSAAKQIEADLAHLKKAMQARIEAATAIVDARSECIRNGYEPRMVECVDVLDWPKRGRKTTFRLDTLEPVAEILMTDVERQRIFKFEEDQEAKRKKEAEEKEPL